MTQEILRECFNRNNCDKGVKHQYEKVYAPLLEKMKDKPRILEIGIFKGAGIQSLIDYFDSGLISNYKITGIDTFQRCPPENIPVLKKNCVTWGRGDSTKATYIEDIDNVAYYDLVIDDGLHTPEAQMKTFNNYWITLKEGGSYIIEDVWPLHLMTEEEKRSHWWMRKYWEEFENSKHEQLMEALKNSGGEIIEHDHRKLTGNPDSFCFEIRKG